ncbi:putative sialin-like protein [Dinothrombium tinctorium]|uniref:Putative sialin-like protein n=1 Tax=Dinothrombium tinctorium TaxID=1965070 RepID=A0A3S3NJF3_9ACAR|nr:putative sialin-like protein [Dinothrombium tinctorium]
MTLCLLLIPLSGYGANASIALLLLLMFFYGLVSGGDIPLAADMTSKYPATVFAFGNMCASVTGFVAPSIVGIILGDANQELWRWSLIFNTTAAVTFFGGVVFLLFATAERVKFD